MYVSTTAGGILFDLSILDGMAQNADEEPRFPEMRKKEGG